MIELIIILLYYNLKTLENSTQIVQWQKSPHSIFFVIRIWGFINNTKASAIDPVKHLMFPNKII